MQEERDKPILAPGVKPSKIQELIGSQNVVYSKKAPPPPPPPPPTKPSKK
jgi:hypothetical protein